MISRIFPLLLVLLTACSHRLPYQGTEAAYRWVTEVPDDLKKLKKGVRRSPAMLEIDFETGDFKGRYKTHNFKGKYRIEHVSSGFVKGFFYRVKAEDLQFPESKNTKAQALFKNLSTSSRLYVAPDTPRDPAYTFLEVYDPNSGTKTLWVKLNHP